MRWSTLTRSGSAGRGAHRGRPQPVLQQGDLAEALAALEGLDEAPVADDLGLAGFHDVELLAVLGLLEDGRPGRELGVLEPGGELLDRGGRERVQHADGAEDLDVRVAHAHARVEPSQRGPGGRHRQRREQADGDEGGADAEQVDDQRREQAADRHAEGEDRLEAGEHPREHGLVGEPREEREAADVDQRVADADEAEQDDRRRLLGREADEGQRRAEQRDADAEPAPEPAAPDEREREQRAEHAAGADGRVEDADARVPRVEEVDRDDDGEHDQAAAREGLDHPQPGDQREGPVPLDGREALQQLAPARARCVRPRRRVVGEGDDDRGGEQRRRGAHGEHQRGAARGEQDGRDQRAGQRGRESSIPRTAFAPVSSCGDFASAGRSAECAGR